MLRSALVAIVLSSSACLYTMQVVPPETRKMCEPTGRSLGVQLAFDRLPKEALASCTDPAAYASPGREAQLRYALAESLRSTGCFSSVVDLDEEPSPAVDFSLRAQVVRFQACANVQPEDSISRNTEIVVETLFRVNLNAALNPEDRRIAVADAVLEDIVLEERATGAIRWSDGVARGIIRERASKEPNGAYAVADRALALLARDVAVKASRAIQGRPLYGLIDLEAAQKRGSVAVVSAIAGDEAAAQASMPGGVKARLLDGFPRAMSTEELGVTREDKKGIALVLAFFADEEDAVNWILSLRPPVQGLEMLLLEPRP